MQSRQEIVRMIESLKNEFNIKNFEHLKLLLFLLQSNMTFFNSSDRDINQALLDVLNIACSQIDQCKGGCNLPPPSQERPVVDHYLSHFSMFHF